ncbi:signal peptidase I [Tsuneonella mangrovi]|uniref:signal peptidase I n=1 Tax=Tsuneonella mangrovi TaxID=1982042 RepID=UPI001F0B45E1|nr:signal peptidase I [Tsuneonella mangrovi]
MTEAASPTPPTESSAKQEPEKETLGSFLWFVIKLAVLVLAFRSFVFSPFSIPSESMLPGLWNGDYLVAAKWPYGYSRYSLPLDAPLIPGRVLAHDPQRGDVVIFKHPIDKVDYIKRVIGLPGDTIEVRNGQVILNGKPVERERIGDFALPMSPNTGCTWGGQVVPVGTSKDCVYVQYQETLPNGKSYDTLDFGPTPQDNFGPVKVPAGHMFVMGDNRDNSEDSRFPAAAGGGVGMVPEDLLVGRATFMMWSTDGSANWFLPWTWFTAARWDRLGNTF